MLIDKILDASGIDRGIADLKPNWLPKAEIPSIVPKLPSEYIHRHRLMKQVINSLLDQPGAGPRDTDDENGVSFGFLSTKFLVLDMCRLIQMSFL